MSLTESKSLFDLTEEAPEHVTFTYRLEHRTITLDRYEWELMGSPTALTVTIRPGYQM